MKDGSSVGTLLSRVVYPLEAIFFRSPLYLVECLEKLSHPMTHLDRKHHMDEGESAILHASNRPLCIRGGSHVKSFWAMKSRLSSFDPLRMS